MGVCCMSFAVVHMQKIKMGGIRGVENHNERLKQSHTNPDINYEKSYLNKDLYNINEFDKRTYYNRVKDRIKELNLPKAVRKDAVTMCGFVCTSDKEYFGKLPQTEQDRFFKESYDFLKNRYGEKNVISGTVHYDEKTPHLHCYIVPVTSDGRLAAKNIFTRKELQNLQADYPKYMNEKGFDLERGISSEGKRKHLDTQEFKIATKQQELEKMKAELDTALYTLKNECRAIEKPFLSLGELNNLEIKENLLKSKITLSKPIFENVFSTAKQGIYNSYELDTLKNENKRLKSEIKEYQDAYYKTTDKVSELNQDKASLKAEIKNLKQQNEAMIKTLGNHNLVPEVQKNFESMKETEKQAERALRKKQLKDMDYER